MPKMIQLRNVPDALHRDLKARAAMRGMSLSDYLISEIRRFAERPTLQELWDRVRDRGSFELIESPADAVRAERDRLE